MSEHKAREMATRLAAEAQSNMKCTMVQVFIPGGAPGQVVARSFMEEQIIAYSVTGGVVFLAVKGNEPEQAVQYLGFPVIATIEPRRIAVPTGVQLVTQ